MRRVRRRRLRHGRADAHARRSLARRVDPRRRLVGGDAGARARAAAASTRRYEHADLRSWRPAAAARLHRLERGAAMGRRSRSPARAPDGLARAGRHARGADAAQRRLRRRTRSCASLWRDPRFAAALGDPPPAVRVRDAAWYGERLLTLGCRPYVWETTYLHHMPDAAAIVEWVKGTALRPALSRLSGSDARCVPRRTTPSA